MTTSEYQLLYVFLFLPFLRINFFGLAMHCEVWKLEVRGSQQMWGSWTSALPSILGRPPFSHWRACLTVRPLSLGHHQ